MSHPSKQKGNRFEKECVDKAKAEGTPAIRAWGSNGRALGMHEEVDAIIGHKSFRVQNKVRNSIASYMQPPESCDVAIIKQDRGEILVVMRSPLFLSMDKHLDDEFEIERDE